MNPDRNHNEIACSQAAPLMHPIVHSSMRLLRFSRWSCDRLASEARLGSLLPSGALLDLVAPSFLASQPLVLFTSQSNQLLGSPHPAINSSSPPRPHQTHPTFSSLTINFYHIARNPSRSRSLYSVSLRPSQGRFLRYTSSYFT